MTAHRPASGRTLHGAPASYPTGLVEVSGGIHAWLQPNGDWSESNAGLIVGDGAAALVDTAWDLPLTRRILQASREATAEPLTTLIATHGDGDHVNGFQLIPEAELVASVGTAADMAQEHPGGLLRSQLGARFLRTFAVGPPRRFGSYVAGMFDPFSFRGIQLRTPDRTFERELTLDIGGRAVQLVRLGPAHTSGDTIVHLPDAAVVFAGDLLFTGVTPNSWSGTVDGWRRALDEIGRLDPAVVVPGHGPVSGRDELALLDRYWQWLEERAGAALRGGASVYEAAHSIVLGDDFAGEPWAAWVCPERTVLNVEIIDRGRSSSPRPITHRERPGLMWQVARLDHAIRTAGAGHVQRRLPGRPRSLR